MGCSKKKASLSLGDEGFSYSASSARDGSERKSLKLSNAASVAMSSIGVTGPAVDGVSGPEDDAEDIGVGGELYVGCAGMTICRSWRLREVRDGELLDGSPASATTLLNDTLSTRVLVPGGECAQMQGVPRFAHDAQLGLIPEHCNERL